VHNQKDDTQPRAKAGRRATWFDPRFAVGVLLVVASTVGVWSIVSAVDRTTEIYQARGALVVGERVTADELTVARVRLGAADSRYLTPATLPHGELVVTRTVSQGEFVPRTAIGTHRDTALTSVVLQLDGALAASVAPGAVVDVWASERLEHDGFAAPAVLVHGATVVRLVKPEGIIASQGTVSVEVRFPAGDVADVLQATSNGARLQIVPAAGSEPTA
jgi:hypothetical protein